MVSWFVYYVCNVVLLIVVFGMCLMNVSIFLLLLIVWLIMVVCMMFGCVFSICLILIGYMLKFEWMISFLLWFVIVIVLFVFCCVRLLVFS